uniref:Uncharacterized protein n=2 Tax=Gibberella zeae (strain ATCC MYA-4620 / CBS 123657 / FGSC 9075 / NRRL 31084 / PH-1) TaxID=229533 RepID=A0A098DSB9_GIBZE
MLQKHENMPSDLLSEPSVPIPRYGSCVGQLKSVETMHINCQISARFIFAATSVRGAAMPRPQQVDT